MDCNWSSGKDGQAKLRTLGYWLPAAQKLIGPLNNSIETNCSSKRNLYSGRRNIDRWVVRVSVWITTSKGNLSSVCGFDREIYVRQIRNPIDRRIHSASCFEENDCGAGAFMIEKPGHGVRVALLSNSHGVRVTYFHMRKVRRDKF